MAYSDFTTSDLIKIFGVNFKSEDLFPNLKPIKPTEWLISAIKKSNKMGFLTEKARSERLVSPVLMELSESNNHSFIIYSGQNLDVDTSLGLKGECDFIFSFSTIHDFILSPIFCIAEAKRQDIEQGTLQVSAQLIGAKKMNELEKNNIKVLYSCSTTGVEWRFVKYENNQIMIDKKRYLINELDLLLGVLQTIIEESKTQNNL